MARSVTPRRRAPASEVTRPPSNAATSSRPPALPNAIPVALHCVGIGECPPSGLNAFSQNKFYPFRDPDAPQPVRDAGPPIRLTIIFHFPFCTRSFSLSRDEGDDFQVLTTELTTEL